MKLIVKWMELQKLKQKLKQTNKQTPHSELPRTPKTNIVFISLYLDIRFKGLKKGMQKLGWREEFFEDLEII